MMLLLLDSPHVRRTTLVDGKGLAVSSTPLSTSGPLAIGSDDVDTLDYGAYNDYLQVCHERFSAKEHKYARRRGVSDNDTAFQLR